MSWIRFTDRRPYGDDHLHGYHVAVERDVSPVVRHDTPHAREAFAEMLEPGWTHWRPVDVPAGPGDQGASCPTCEQHFHPPTVATCPHCGQGHPLRLEKSSLEMENEQLRLELAASRKGEPPGFDGEVMGHLTESVDRASAALGLDAERQAG